jgi:hypothetical protein
MDEEVRDAAGLPRSSHRSKRRSTGKWRSLNDSGIDDVKCESGDVTDWLTDRFFLSARPFTAQTYYRKS